MFVEHDPKADVDDESTARRRTPGQGGQPKKPCKPCLERIGFKHDVLTLAEAEERARDSDGQLRPYRCRCDTGAWHVLQKYGPAPAAFSDSGP